jgi:hypothetical protein
MSEESVDGIHGNVTASLMQKIKLNFPPDSLRMPEELSHPDILNTILDITVHWIAYFIATLSVVTSLLICMAVVLFLSVYLLEMISVFFEEVYAHVKARGRPASF